jgi:uncharacterized protein (TIGR00369 family)
MNDSRPSQLDQFIHDAKHDPFQQFCGLELIQAAAGKATTQFLIGPNTTTSHGWLHGGILYGLLDTSSYLALLPLLEEHETAVSHDVNFSIMRRTQPGSVVTIRTEVLRKGNRVAFIRAEAFSGENGAEKLIAAGHVTKSIIEKG